MTPHPIGMRCGGAWMVPADAQESAQYRREAPGPSVTSCGQPAGPSGIVGLSERQNGGPALAPLGVKGHAGVLAPSALHQPESKHRPWKTHAPPLAIWLMLIMRLLHRFLAY